MTSVTQHPSNNVEGNYFVDSTCINCDTCREIAPNVIQESEGEDEPSNISVILNN